MTTATEQEHPAPASAREEVQPTRDVGAEVADLTSRNPVDPQFEAAFLRSKVHVAKTHPLSDLRDRAPRLEDLGRQLARPDAEAAVQPLPGGVGYGTFYAAGFKTAFDGGAEVMWNIVCPEAPGGDVASFLYLTATNRTSLGVEALIGYAPDGAMSFLVYDWAMPDQPPPGGATSARWTVSLARAYLADYLGTRSAPAAVGGQALQVLPVINSTTETASGRWRNTVLLFNHARNGWDQIYAYDYPAGLPDQKAEWVGSWGPIVETFQPSFSGTAPLGALGVQLRARNAGAWSDWKILAAADSELRDDHRGFHPLLIDPNHDWIVVS